MLLCGFSDAPVGSIGPMSHAVVHAWDAPFQDLVDALSHYHNTDAQEAPPSVAVIQTGEYGCLYRNHIKGFRV